MKANAVLLLTVVLTVACLAEPFDPASEMADDQGFASRSCSPSRYNESK